MELVGFEIYKIYAGWFDIIFTHKNIHSFVTASDAWETDSPQELLSTLCEINTLNNCYRYVIWDEEPGVYIICFSKISNKYSISVYNSSLCHHELPKVIIENNNLEVERIKDIIGDLELEFDVNDIDFDYFIQTVIRSFQEYERGQELINYEENWMSFPHEQLNLLKKNIH